MLNNFRNTIWIILAFSLAILSCGKKKIELLSEQLEISTTHHITAVYFIDESIGFAAGGSRYTHGIIMKTTDGGENWSIQSVLNKIVYDLDFRDKQRGFAACYEGKILRTVDGGDTWELHQTPYWKFPLYQIEFLNDSVGFAVGGAGYASGVILKTTDAGDSWEGIDFPRELRSIGYADNDVFLGGYGILLHSKDQGSSWDTTGVEGDLFRDIEFTDANTGYLIGAGGSIYKTENSGESWERIRNGNSIAKSKWYMHACHFTDPLTGYVIGNEGLLIKTTNGGREWRRVKKFTDEMLQDVSIPSSGFGIVVGENGTMFRFSE